MTRPRVLRPMRAATLSKEDVAALRYPVLVSPKLDGVRAIVLDGVLRSRKMKRLPNLEARRMMEIPALEGLDGELTLGSPTRPNCCAETSGFLNSPTAKAADTGHRLLFHVFDSTRAIYRPFHERLTLAAAQTGYELPFVRVVAHQPVKNEKELRKVERELVREGYEGIMIRDPNGPYKYGRSTRKEGWLSKLKRFQDSEAVILSVRREMKNNNTLTKNELGYAKRRSLKANKVPKSQVGSLLVRDLKTKVVFKVGSGIDEALGKKLLKEQNQIKGRIIKYRFQPAGVKDKPRFPRFLSFRERWDL